MEIVTLKVTQLLMYVEGAVKLLLLAVVAVKEDHMLFARQSLKSSWYLSDVVHQICTSRDSKCSSASLKADI